MPTLDELRDLDEINPDLFAEFEAKVESAGEEAAAQPDEASAPSGVDDSAEPTVGPEMSEVAASEATDAAESAPLEIHRVDEEGEPS